MPDSAVPERALAPALRLKQKRTKIVLYPSTTGLVMLRISKLTDYGRLVLAQLPADGEGLASAGQVANATHLSQPTVSKLLKSLAHAGLF